MNARDSKRQSTTGASEGPASEADAFSKDVADHGGYVYTTSDKLSCRLSNQRMTDAILEVAVIEGKRVIDIGCGDGTYTLELAQAGAVDVLGVDPAEAAIESARSRAASYENIRFKTVDVYALDQLGERFDLAVLRGALHHLPDPETAIRRICEVADEIVTVEPNGYNPVLKLLERVSPYHVEHQEKSFRPSQLDAWFESCGGHVEWSLHIGLVPFFCPDPIARLCKSLEGAVERTPLLRAVCCAQYVQRITMTQARDRCPC